jgi:hypothetical protein
MKSKTNVSDANVRLMLISEGNYRLSEDKTKALKDAVSFCEYVMGEINESLFVMDSNIASAETKMEASVYKGLKAILSKTRAELKAFGVDEG